MWDMIHWFMNDTWERPLLLFIVANTIMGELAINLFLKDQSCEDFI